MPVFTKSNELTIPPRELGLSKYEFVSPSDLVVGSGCKVFIETGLFVDLPTDKKLSLRPILFETTVQDDVSARGLLVLEVVNERNTTLVITKHQPVAIGMVVPQRPSEQAPMSVATMSLTYGLGPAEDDCVG